LEAFLRDIPAADSGSRPQPAALAPALTLSNMLEDLRERHRPLDERYRKAERAINALQELIEAETKFHNATKGCSDAHRILTEKVDVEPFQTRVRELGHNQGQILEDYNRRASELSESEVGDIVDHATISKVKQETDQLAKCLQEMTTCLKQVWKDYVKECGYFVGSIRQMIRLAKRQDASLRTDPVEARCKVLLRTVESQEWPEKPMSHYETIKTRIRDATMELLKKTLDEAEGNTLMAVVDRREQSESGWFNFSQIAQEIAKEVAISEAEAERLLRSLVQKGYLTEGIAIPV